MVLRDMKNEEIKILKKEKERQELKVFAKEIIESKGNDFDNEKWTFLSENAHTRINIDFEKMVFIDRYTIENIKIFSCMELREKSPHTVASKTNLLVQAMKESNNFAKDERNVGNFLELLFQSSDLKIKKIQEVMTEFKKYTENKENIDYYLEQIEDIFILELDMKRSRKLPHPKNVLELDACIEGYFEEVENERDDITYAYYFPIYFWWKFSNIIPIRLSEMVNIERNALELVNGSYYINFNRSGEKGNKNSVQLIDKIKIAEEIAEKTIKYIELTENDGYTETLFSYPTTKKIKEMKGNYTAGAFQKVVEEKYNKNIMDTLLKQFYEEVVRNKLNRYISDEERVRLGDTRHFAFINMMKQGYDTLQIARLGGHINLETQYHYQNHKEFYMDFEFIKFLNKNNFIVEEKNLFGLTDLKDVLKNNMVLKTKEYKKLDVGLCADENQLCPVDNCFLCPNFKITFDELEKNKEKIVEEISKIDNQIEYVVKALYDLHKSINKHEGLHTKNEMVVQTKNKFKTYKEKIGKLTKEKEELYNIKEKVISND